MNLREPPTTTRASLLVAHAGIQVFIMASKDRVGKVVLQNILCAAALATLTYAAPTAEKRPNFVVLFVDVRGSVSL